MEYGASFIEACREIGRAILNSDNSHPIYIFSHFDADGIAAASILAKTLSREGLSFHLRIFERLEYQALNKLKKIIPNGSMIIFADIGTGVIEALLDWVNEIFILDHHTPSYKTEIPKNINFLNPHDHTIDGTSDISGAGVAYFVSMSINSQNKDLAPLAIIGALGDRQDQGQNSSLLGLNEIIVKDAKNCEMLSDDISVWFFDRSRPIISILQRADFFDNELEIKSFLDKLQIKYKAEEELRPFYDLTEEEFRLLASELIIQYNVNPNEIYKRDYQLIKEEAQFLKDARVFATKLNACGRLKRPDVGISLCLGNRQRALRDLQSIEKKYTRMIAKGINWALTNNHLKELSGIYYLDGRNEINERIIGTIISILNSRKIITPKPILGCTGTSTEKIKVSMRIPRLLKNKINLNLLLKAVVDEINPEFEVGGHKTAAGALISEDSLNDFVSRINQLVEEGL